MKPAEVAASSTPAMNVDDAPVDVDAVENMPIYIDSATLTALKAEKGRIGGTYARCRRSRVGRTDRRSRGRSCGRARRRAHKLVHLVRCPSDGGRLRFEVESRFSCGSRKRSETGSMRKSRSSAHRRAVSWWRLHCKFIWVLGRSRGVRGSSSFSSYWFGLTSFSSFPTSLPTMLPTRVGSILCALNCTFVSLPMLPTLLR